MREVGMSEEQAVAEKMDMIDLLGFKQNAVFDLLTTQLDRFGAADVRLGIVLAGLVAISAIGTPSGVSIASVLVLRGVMLGSLLLCGGAFLGIVPRGDHWAGRRADYARHPELVTSKVLDEVFTDINGNDTRLAWKQASALFGGAVALLVLAVFLLLAA
jgi:hypothetical protein